MSCAVGEVEDYSQMLVSNEVSDGKGYRPTFFNAVLFGLAVALDLACYALGALVIVVLGRSACFGLLAL